MGFIPQPLSPTHKTMSMPCKVVANKLYQELLYAACVVILASCYKNMTKARNRGYIKKNFCPIIRHYFVTSPPYFWHNNIINFSQHLM